MRWWRGSGNIQWVASYNPDSKGVG
nr:hypothetical protein Itr_chr08CG17160 [Ipomoea trifida]